MKLKLLYSIILLSCFTCFKSQAQKGWINLFNGKDLKDWTVKIAKHDLNDNYGNTFRVEDGLMKVRYDGYTDFDQQYGHIYYKKPFSSYLIKITYRFVGEQAKGGEGWALRNSGVMLHCQAPETILKDQDFPISIEGQILGGDGEHDRHTSNVCTPGTQIDFQGKLFTQHCLDSKSKTYHGDQWVTAEFLVLGDSVIKHIINKEVVLEYTKPQIGGGSVSNYDPKVKTDGKPLTSGYISLQSESHPIEFKTVKLFDLQPYVKSKAKLDKILEKILNE
ncbi:3-keto-disaccharide hydrolase [Pedobacter sp.]|uniref:3-keto-disaccharide hydrolase n=1 Tax=Pedobacter sp. TaxID=1411316 RepID=UPI003BA9055F